MSPQNFRGKPSDTHVIWRRNGAGGRAKKRFDEEALRKWCSACSLDFETSKRVDHERAGETRQQYRVVFSWTEDESQSFDLGDDKWEIETQKTPRTFLEIDSAGEARLKSWTDEHVLDLQELWFDGPTIFFDASELDGKTRLDARELRSEPD